ncbi:MAG TPA: response regulator [Dongiaceae bacterium]|nr:response regulator [Dongiaceae bacterium]
MEVHDTGIGVSPEAKSRLFQKFQQADGSITRRFGGTGLGLSICRQLVDLMGGRIGMDDRRGGGSTFWVEVTLPNGLGRRATSRATDLRGVRILVVDDIELNRSIFARQLLGDGAIVTEASSGLEGLRAIRQADDAGEPFDVVLLDHMMPGIAGDEVAEQIRSHSRWRQPKLVLASSIGTPISTDRAAQVGFDAFLTKPVRHQALVGCLTGLIGEPAAPGDPGDMVPAEAEIVGRPGARVLLAEDNDINTLLARTLLEGEGYVVDCVKDGVEAVGAARTAGYDLVLMDIQMPTMGGLEATQLIRALPGAAAKVPIVAMTANAMARDVEACLAAGMDEHISKPIDPAEFLRVVGRFLSADGMPGADALNSLNLPDVDVSHLDGLARLLPAARFIEMLGAYLERARHGLERIEFLILDGDLKGVAALAHDLKSTSGSFGARRLQYLAEALETAARAGDAATASRLLSPTCDAANAAWEIILRRLSNLGLTVEGDRQAS